MIRSILLGLDDMPGTCTARVLADALDFV